MTSAATWLGRLLAKEPVMLGSVILAWVAVLQPSELVLAAATITVGLIVRWLSVPVQKAAEEAQVAASGAADAREVHVNRELGKLALSGPPSPAVVVDISDPTNLRFPELEAEHQRLMAERKRLARNAAARARRAAKKKPK